MATGNPVLDRALAHKNNRVAEVAEAAGISKFTLWRMIREGQVTGVRVGRVVMVPPASTLRLLGHEQPLAA
jgi:excisionase family DNA binding protein